MGKCHSLWRERKSLALFEEQVGNKRQQSLKMLPALRLAHQLLRVYESPRTSHLPRWLHPRAQPRRCTQPREGLGLLTPMGVGDKVPVSVSQDTAGWGDREDTYIGDGGGGGRQEVRRRRSWWLVMNGPPL